MPNTTQQLIKSYADRTYIYTATVSHRGMIVAFALDEQRRIYYAVLDMSRPDSQKGDLDMKYWPEDPKELQFPNEIEQVGYSIVGAIPMPLVKKGSRLEAKPDSLHPREVDAFLSTTARLTASAPFQVFSDNKHIFVFRQSLPVDHEDMVYKLRTGQMSGDGARAEDEFVLDSGAKVPIVKNTLLCDRFILAGSILQRKLEVRYQRSRHKTKPAGATDGLGTKDMEGRPFFEPTQELAFVKNLQLGRFSVLQLPTEVSSIKRWQIFSHNSASDRIDSFNLEVSSDGLFNPAGSQLYTSPDGQYQNSVLERQPGTCPFTGLPLVPLVSKSGHAESCLQFDGQTYAQATITPWTTQAFTLELWVKPDRTDQAQWTGLFASASSGAPANSFQVDFDGVGNYALTHNTQKVAVLGQAANHWQHLAITYDGSKLRTYLDGNSTHESEIALTLSLETYLLGANRGLNLRFVGCMDEVRIWDYARLESDLVANKNSRLTGGGPGLVSYYRFDEAGGNSLHDQTENAHDAQITGNPIWVSSNADIGDSAGIRRSSFTLVAEQTEPIEITRPTVTLTAEEEQAVVKTKLITETIEESFTPKCLHFDGSSYVEIPYSQNLSTNEFTISLWAKVTGGQGGHRSPLTFRDNRPEHGIVVYVNPDDSWVVLLGLDRGWEYIPATIQFGQWAHIAVTYDGSSMELFVNGVSLERKATKFYRNTRRPLRIGAGATEGNVQYHFWGDITEVQIWNKALSISEIQKAKDWYLEGNEVGLVAYYPYVEGSGNRLVDATGNGHDGTFFGSPNWQDAGFTLTRTITRQKEIEVTEPVEINTETEVSSDEPLLIDHSGPRTLVGGFSTRLYYQQETMATGYDGQRKPMKRNVRLMLATPTVAGDQPDSAALTTVDFAVSREGRLAQVSDALVLPVLMRPQGVGDARAITQNESIIRGLNEDIDRLSNEIELARVVVGKESELNTSKQTLETDLTQLRSTLENERNSLRNYWFRMKVESSGKYVTQRGGYLYEAGSSDTPAIFKLTGEKIDYKEGGSLFNMYEGVVVKQEDFQIVRISNISGGRFYLYVMGGSIFGSSFQIGIIINSGKLITSKELPYKAEGVYFTAEKKDLCTNRLSELEDQIRATEAELSAVTEKLAELPTYKSQLRQKEAELIDKQNLLLNKKAQLNLASGGSQGEISLPIERVHSDRSGLTIGGGLLAFAQSTNTPLLFDSATSKLTAYFRSPEGRLMAGYMDTNVTRARFELVSGSDQLVFLARSAGSHLNEATIAITSGNTDETCTVTLTCPALELTEVWQNLPRDPNLFTSIINGQMPLPENASTSISPATYSLVNGSTQIIVVAENTTTAVPDGTATRLIRGTDNQWIADAPGQAYFFDGDQHQLTTTEAIERFAPNANFTLEAWVNPSVANTATRLIHHNGANAAYLLGLEQAESNTAFGFTGNGRVECPLPPDLIGGDRSFTVECWVYFTNMVSGQRLLQVSQDADNYLELAQMATQIQLTVNYNGQHYQTGSDFLPQEKTWYHLACVWDGVGKACRLYLNSDFQSAKGDATTVAGVASAGVVLGSLINGDRPFNGYLDEIRLWNYPRLKEDIQLGQYRRAYVEETGLVSYYTFEDKEPLDRSGNGYHGITHGTVNLVSSCASLRRYSLIGGVSGGHSHTHDGQRLLRSSNTLEANHWTHVAANFSQSYALKFGGAKDWVECERSVTLDIIDDLTIEIFLQLSQLSQTHGLISKGRLGQAEQSVPYQLAIEPGGRLRFTFEDGNGDRHDYRSTQALTSGQFHRIAVTRKKGMTQSEKKGSQIIEFTDADGNVQSQSIEMIESVDMEEWVDITFHIDGKTAGVSRYTGQPPSGHDGSLEIGRNTLVSGKANYLQGTISEVRLWRTARKARQIAKSIEGHEQGLIGWWRFEESEGNVALDSKGNQHGKISGAQRIKNPDPAGSQFNLFINGLQVESDAIIATDNWVQQGWGEPQFSLGGTLRNNASHELFNGMLEEIRIWRIVRTHEQMLDNLFGRLKGEKQDLIAYYTFDDASTELDANQLYDNGLRGCNLPLPTGDKKPAIMLSTAPISNDASIVRSALSGLETAFQSTVDSTPSVQEYGDLQRDSQGNLGGVMKRCYSYLRNGQWYLFAGYKVGNLVTEWIGQAQFDPQVIGYVEGCPPLPSENLTDGAISSEYENYAFVETLSNLEIVESETVSYTVSSSTEGSIDTSFDAGVAKKFSVNTSILTAPMGFGTSIPIVEGDITLAATRHAEGSVGWDSEQSFGTSINRSRNLSVELGGSWESPDASQQLNPAVGRRLSPGNMGFALVQSETADIFALRLAHNNALVSFRMQPNPDIPKDWNLIPFPINPRYVKQGTLDGRIGYNEQGSIVLDPDYANALGYGEYSYFKPREAYALKRRIQREEQQLRHYYEVIANEAKNNPPSNQSMGTLAGATFQAMSSMSPPLGRALEEFDASNNNESQSTDLPKKFAKRNLVNTYVWTADGGFFAETTETSDVRTESASSSFSLSSSTAFSANAELAFFGAAGFSLEFEAAMGGGYAISRTSDQESERSFSVELTVDPPGDLQAYRPKLEGGIERIYDDDGNAVNAAGKVDAYRFMTFYLDSDKNNFEDLYQKVIDPIWLAESDHPNAIALRQANQAVKKPACWRLLHRVTFVSRLLPDFADPTAASLGAAMKAENIDSNWQLIQKLEPFVRNKTGDTIAFNQAVREALQRYLPELLPHAVEIIQYLQLYYGMTE